MPEFKRLAEGERPADQDKYLLIEELWEPFIGLQYRFVGSGCHLESEYTDTTWEGMRQRASALAEKWGLQVVYLSRACSPDCDSDRVQDGKGGAKVPLS
ncbi:hypothetical protein [Microvirga sp. G4-2]|uniref:hypothetical protein n=1 Tax=Microvirga sp. G4-2 TaxID=3434467 RepID=UPI0040449D8D